MDEILLWIFMQLCNFAMVPTIKPITEHMEMDMAKTVWVLGATARPRGADGVPPGYGSRSKTADFPQPVINAGLTWVGPRPAAIRRDPVRRGVARPAVLPEATP